MFDGFRAGCEGACEKARADPEKMSQVAIGSQVRLVPRGLV